MSRSLRFGVAGALLLLAPIASAAPASKSAPSKSLLEGCDLFQVGSAHSSIEFSVAWMGISRVRGVFSDFSGTLVLDRSDMLRSSITIIARTRSLTTFNDRRDRDLKSADWFDVDKFPNATFQSREVAKQGAGYVLRGPLTLRGVTKDVEIPFAYNGKVREEDGNERVGFEGQVSMNRKDYGIVGPETFNAIVEIGKAMVGDEIELRLAVEGVRTAPRDTMQDRAADSLWRAITARGATVAMKRYRELRAVTPDSLMPVDEPRLNAVGYQLAGLGDPASALELFRAQSEAYPQSASGLTGMAHAAAMLGDRTGAVANAEKAIALNPSATRALEILRRARGTAVN